MPQERILVVDDEPLDLAIIEEFLTPLMVELDLENNPEVAWEKLETPGRDYALVLLDRRMSSQDGLELLHRIKGDPRFANLPVILQTAASSPEEVREGLEAGAYYYLTKPYESHALLSIIQVALEDHRNRLQMRYRVAHPEAAQMLLRVAEYRFATLEDINRLVPVLAALCPKPETVAPGLSDIMVNAVEHGNLGLTYQEKASLKWDGDWEEEIRRRLSLPQFHGRFGTVRYECREDRVVFTITDQGEGFDWRHYLHFDPERAFDPNGRGIAMARALSFTSLEYQGKGNVAVASVALNG